MFRLCRGQLHTCRETLLLPAGARDDVELGQTGREQSGPRPGDPQVEVVRTRWLEHLLAIGLLVALVVPSVTIAVVVVGEWHSRPEQRGWLILGFGFYIAAAMRTAWKFFLNLCSRILYLRVELRRFTAPTLFESVTDALAKNADANGLTCSWDQEAVQEHDKLSGDISVKLRFWSSRPRDMDVWLTVSSPDGEDAPAEKLRVQVHFSPGEDVVIGRDSRLERREILVLTMRTSPDTARRDKVLLKRWFEDCYRSFTKPVQGIVNVYALQESSSDWVPEWKFERVKQLKKPQGTGQDFFLVRESLREVLADARLWAKSSLRVYMVTGPPGVGKSEFTIWLAGELGLPVYRLCLSSPRLTDDRLAQLLSQSAVTFDSVLVQIDEFQGTVKRWIDGGSNYQGVTPGGFCECLQGSTAMGKGVVVLTGTNEIVAESVKQQFPAVFRRIHSVAMLSWMTQQDVGQYFRQFLQKFVDPKKDILTDEDWDAHVQAFLCRLSPWTSGSISVDMLKQYLMHQITKFFSARQGPITDSHATGVGGGDAAMQIPPNQFADFFRSICDTEEGCLFLSHYAPVQAVYQGHTEVLPCGHRVGGRQEGCAGCRAHHAQRTEVREAGEGGSIPGV